MCIDSTPGRMWRFVGVSLVVDKDICGAVGVSVETNAMSGAIGRCTVEEMDNAG